MFRRKGTLHETSGWDLCVLQQNEGEPLNNNTNSDLNHVLNQAKEELIGLVKQKGEVTKRIGTIKQTIAGLADLFGNEVLDEELLELLDRKTHSRQPGFTRECRFALMDSRSPMTARAVCDCIREKNAAILTHHKDPIASVTTVLNRLVAYGEAESLVLDIGKRAWKWRSELPSERPQEEHRPYSQ